ncbi:MAG: tetratricopeptide repeat protein, partial [Bacteroidetes bacterium]
NISSDAIPKVYPLVWIGLTVALSVLIGFLGSLVLSRSIGKRIGFMPLAILLFVALFPLAYIMVKDSALYDGWRQLLFVYPTMLIVAALFYDQLSRRLEHLNWGQYAVLGGLLLLSADALLFTLRNPGLAYVYFNPLGGGVRGAFGNYELDYWGLSTKQAIDKLEAEGILHPQMDTLVLGTTFEYNIRRQLDPSYRQRVKLRYVRAAKRFGEKWDYGIFPSRFLRGAHLRNGTWPNSKSVYTITVNGVPVTSIERDVEQYAMEAEAALKAGDAARALQLFEQEVAKYPDNEQGWTGLASAALSLGKYKRALEATEQALRVAPDNETALYLRAYAKLQSGQVNEAMAEFNYLLKVDPENAMAYYWLGEIHLQRQELQTAFEHFRKAIERNPRFKQAYLRIADLFESQGDSQNAQAYRQAASQM